MRELTSREQSLRIAVIAGEYPPRIRGGLGIQVYETVRLLQRSHDIEVFVVSDDSEGWYHTVLQSELGSTKVHELPTSVGLVARPGDALLREPSVPHADFLLQRHEAEPFDVVHAHDWQAVPLAAVARARGCPMLFTVHLPAISRFTYGREKPNFDRIRLEALGCRLARRITTVSQAVKKALEMSYSVPPSKIDVIHNGVDPLRFRPGKARNRAVVLSVSRMAEQKGLSFLISAAELLVRQLEGIQFLVVGDGPARSSIERLVAEAGLSDTVHFLGFQPYEDLPRLYQQASLFVSTSIYEPFGMTTLEAMASGLPIVAFQTGGIPEFVRSGSEGILIPRFDASELAEGIKTVITNDKLREHLGRAARRVAAQRFPWSCCAEALERAYYELVPGGGEE